MYFPSAISAYKPVTPSAMFRGTIFSLGEDDSDSQFYAFPTNGGMTTNQALQELIKDALKSSPGEHGYRFRTTGQTVRISCLKPSSSTNDTKLIYVYSLDKTRPCVIKLAFNQDNGTWEPVGIMTTANQILEQALEFAKTLFPD